MRRKREAEQDLSADVPSRELTPVDVQQKEFSLAFRGYNEADVDRFLDEVTEELARLREENKRLREQLEFSGTAPLDTTQAVQADRIVREAREEASRILTEAEARAEAIGRQDATAAYSSSEAPSGAAEGSGRIDPRYVRTFLGREREFLRNLAEMIQRHADGVKEDLRKARHTTPPPPASERTAAPDSAATEVASRLLDPAAGSATTKIPRARSAEAEAGRPDPEVDAVAEPEPPTPAAEPRVDRARADAELGDDGEPRMQEAEGLPASAQPDHGAASTGRAGARIAPRPAPSPRPLNDEEDGREDASLRELFWGEE